ncbi:MAG: cellulase family glycosylhydrolase [Fibrobacteres bacterium]|nr:cellulase family glycosylhydrolase [Fibrobacterota bacterium]
MSRLPISLILVLTALLGPASALEPPVHVSLLDTATFRTKDSSISIVKYLDIPVDSLRGWQVMVTAWSSADSLTTRVQSWNGVKVMLIVTGADGVRSYPQLPWPEGQAFAHKRSMFRYTVAKDVKSIQLAWGIEKVAGVAKIDSICIRRFAWMDLPERDSTLPIPDFSPTRLRGAQVGPTLTRQAVTEFGRTWKGNLMRWQFWGSDSALAESTYDSILDYSIRNLDSYLPTFKTAGIKVVLCMHNLSRGLFRSTQTQSKLIETWRKLALHYRDSSQIWAYDLANEPDMNKWQEGVLLWDDLADTLARAVRAIDTGKVIVVETPFGDVPTFPQLRPVGWRRGYDIPKVVYSFHYYWPFKLTHQGIGEKYPPFGAIYPGTIDGKFWDTAMHRKTLAPALAFQKKYRVPIYVGEFSCVRWAADHSSMRWFSDVIPLFEEYGWDWSYHAYKEFHGWSLEFSDSLGDMRDVPNSGRKALFQRFFSLNKHPYDSAATGIVSGRTVPWSVHADRRGWKISGLPIGSRVELSDLRGHAIWTSIALSSEVSVLADRRGGALLRIRLGNEGPVTAVNVVRP